LDASTKKVVRFVFLTSPCDPLTPLLRPLDPSVDTHPNTKRYKSRVEQESGHGATCDFSHPVYVTVAFYATCLRLKPAIVIDRKKLLQVSGVSIQIFREKLNDIVRLCFPDLDRRKSVSTSSLPSSSSSSSSSSTSSSSSSSSCESSSPSFPSLSQSLPNASLGTIEDLVDTETVESVETVEVREGDETTVMTLGKRQRTTVELHDAPSSPTKKKHRPHQTEVVEIEETESLVVTFRSSD